MHSVYKHTDNGYVRYIGVTAKSPVERLEKHLEEARGPKSRKSHRLNWLRSLAQPPIVETIELVGFDNAASRERYWISLARAYGCVLVNGTEGGESVNSLTPEVREKISAAQRGRPKSPEQIEEMRRARLGKPLSPAMHAAALAANLGRPRSLEVRAKISVAQLGEKNHRFGKPVSDEHRKKISSALVGRPRSLEVRAKISAGHLRRAAKNKSSK